ncbi:MAG: TonB-dependent receptor [Ferruginibacter sp.]
MRITAILLLSAALTASASGNSQTVTLDLKDVPIQKVFKEVIRQTGTSIIYNEALFKNISPISIKVKDASITDVLGECLKGLPFTFDLEGNAILIKKSLKNLFTSPIIEPQQDIVHGRVTDSEGKPISDATVVNKRTKKGVSTDTNGNFSIAGDEGDMLDISHIGYKDVEQKVSSSNAMSIVMQQHVGALGDIVVVAYGQQKKTNITGSVATIKGDFLANKPFSSIDKSFQGAVAGVLVTSQSGSPGGSTDINIRGLGSLLASSNPLWVIDGVVATTDASTSNLLVGTGFSNNSTIISSLNPDDIESVTILKDAAATSIYGSRAGNGVILVTTKKGKAGKTRFDFSTELGQNSIAYNPTNKPMTTAQYKTIFRQGIINAGLATDNAGADAYITSTGGISDPAYANNVNTDWRDVVSRTGNQAQYNLSISGGNEKTQYAASAGYFNQMGVVRGADYKRYNGGLSITNKATNRLTLSATINGSSNLSHQILYSTSNSNPVLAQQYLLPWYSPYNADGSLKFSNSKIPAYISSASNDPYQQFPATGKTGYNPLALAANVNYPINRVAFRGNVAAEYKILDNLKFTSRYAAEYFDTHESIYNSPFYGGGISLGGYAEETDAKVFDYTWSNFVDWKKYLNTEKDIYLDFKIGYEAQQYKYDFSEVISTNFPQTLSLQYVASAATPFYTYALPSGNATTSLFSVADVNYKDRYVLSGSFRRDGSSVFGANNKYGNFYSIGFAWNASEEKFIKDVKWISLLKLRSSYGQNGNSLGFGNYAPLATFAYGLNNYGNGVNYNYGGSPGSYLSNIGNSNLTWELNKPFNIGLDWGLWKYRFTGTVEYYHRTTSNLLAQTTLSVTSGFPKGQVANVGSIENKGIELTLDGKPLVTKNFSWEIGFNIAHNQNRVTSLYKGSPILSGDFAYTVGHDIQEFYKVQWAGVDPANGNPQWYTDGTHTTKTSVFAQAKPALSGVSADPKYFGSITNTFMYKEFSLTAQFYFNEGNYIFDRVGGTTSSDGFRLGTFNQLSNQLTAWKNPGDITNVPRIVYGGNQNSYQASTRYLYKDDYIRLRNLQLNYNLPTSLLKKIRVNNLNVFVRGTNLFTFVRDKNLPFDPETGINYNSTTNYGLFLYMPKTISAGAKIDF